MPNFTLRPATDSDYPAIVAIINAQTPEPTTADDLRRQDSLMDADDHLVRILATSPDGTLLGYGVCQGGKFNTPGQFNVNTRVVTEHRGLGIARAIYSQLEAYAREHGASKLQAGVRETETIGVEWAKRLGFAVDLHMFESKLDLTAFDPGPLEDSVRAARDRGIQFTTLADEGIDDETLERYFEFLWEMNRDIPGSHDEPKPPFELVKKVWTEDPKWDPKAIILAVEDGQWAAIGALQKMESGGYYNNFTAVRRESRSHGLALAIKVVGIKFAQAQGVPYMRTNNHSQNAPMLAVNRKLGYIPEPGMFSLLKPL